MLETRTGDKMKEVLKDPDSDGPEIAYFVMRGNPNVTIWEAGKYGDEYNKTYGHYHRHDESESYQILLGEGIGILQHINENGDVDEVRLIKAKAGDTVTVPKGSWAHAFANTGSTYLVTSDNAPSNASHSQNDYEPVKEKKGMAYYVVEEKGNPKVIPNPMYQNLPQPKWIDPDGKKL